MISDDFKEPSKERSFPVGSEESNTGNQYTSKYLAETSFAEDHQKVEISRANDVFSAHVVWDLPIEFGWDFGGLMGADDRSLLTNLLAENFRVDPVADGYIIKFTFFFREQLEPAFHGSLNDFGYAKRERAHEIITRGTIPIPHFHQESSVLVLRF